ncbi:poly(A)-specific ribonuclease [Tieghemiomyces parasiticus]|uniref:Poly(A)-specific ribonuclease n=1 Tax=Tieghemiomyces parasiticus TaxID=78921 RepID=A0A9W8DSE9_9FUNG|nr:poly(A)-specific ribonuclease [Tieghemiomyces parasiticus]
MDDWAELAQVYDVPGHLPPYPISRVAFDTHQALIWVAYSNGRITSYVLDHPITKYTSFVGHRDEVVDLVVHPDGILSVSASNVRFTARTGLVKFQLPSKASRLVYSSVAVSPTNANMVYISDRTGHGLVVDLERGRTVREFRIDYEVVRIRHSQYLCTATATGTINIKDPLTLRTVTTVDPRLSALADLAVGPDRLFASGLAFQRGGLFPSPQATVYDLHALAFEKPVEFLPGPELLAVDASDADRLVVASRLGQFQIVRTDAMPSGTEPDPVTHQLTMGNFGRVTAVAMAPTGEALAFGDFSGVLHVWSNSPNPVLVCAADPLVLPGTDNLPPLMDFDDRTPLSRIGLPYYDEPLLSRWPPNALVTIPSRPMGVDPAILDKAKWNDFVGYAPNPRNRHRNQVAPRDPRRRDGPKFRSEQEFERQRGGRPGALVARRGSYTTPTSPRAGGSHPHEPLSPLSPTTPPTESAIGGPSATAPSAATSSAAVALRRMPRYYRRVEIRYSRFGVDDFDFEYYNRTQLSGLETHIANSYLNSLLQALFYLPVFTDVCVAHLALPCPAEACLLCEIGFLFRMLQDAQGANCQATNFLRVFSTIPQAAALGLLEPEQPGMETAYGSLIQAGTRFLLQQFHQAWFHPGVTPPRCALALGQSARTEPAPPTDGPDASSPMLELFACHIESTSTCASGHTSARQLRPYVIDLVYPKAFAPLLSSSVTSATAIQYGYHCPEPAGLPEPRHTLSAQSDAGFIDLLHAALEPFVPTKVWCDGCRQYQQQQQAKACVTLPPVLVVNCAVKQPEEAQYWARHDGHWLPAAVAMSLRDGLDIRPVPSDNGGSEAAEPLPDHFDTYEITAIVSEIKEEGKPAHLVAHVRRGDPAQWYLINDFLVRETSAQEALRFGTTWRTPSVLFLTKVGTATAAAPQLATLPHQIDPRILITPPRFNKQTEAVQFTADELPLKPGYLCALDAEFVMERHPQTEIRSDGTRHLVRPRQMTLARVSVVRGEGPHAPAPFIDDYVATMVPIVDYLTAFSGIHEGDLHPRTSTKHLLPLKLIYKKLRYLVDTGCVFVGHGLSNDLRTINIYIPPAQVIDTVDIFRFRDRPRRISLKFLTWCILHTEIQQETHCSVEDATMTLQLYRKSLELKASGHFERVLEDVYEQGAILGWKPPTDEPSSAVAEEAANRIV